MTIITIVLVFLGLACAIHGAKTGASFEGPGRSKLGVLEQAAGIVLLIVAFARVAPAAYISFFTALCFAVGLSALVFGSAAFWEHYMDGEVSRVHRFGLKIISIELVALIAWRLAT